jgi:uncharacterized Tic20 family protein
MLGVVAPVFHRYEYGGVPPLAVDAANPLLAVQEEEPQVDTATKGLLEFKFTVTVVLPVQLLLSVTTTV